jgi:hypothetical protein
LTAAVLLLAGLYIVSVWAFRLPAVPRLYLPALSLMVIGLASQLGTQMRTRHGRWLLAAYLAANYAVGTYGVLTAWC